MVCKESLQRFDSVILASARRAHARRERPIRVRAEERVRRGMRARSVSGEAQSEDALGGSLGLESGRRKARRMVVEKAKGGGGIARGEGAVRVAEEAGLFG